jgi:hypothetical protein
MKDITDRNKTLTQQRAYAQKQHINTQAATVKKKELKIEG